VLKENYYLITGGPGSGKSSVINSLHLQSYTVVDEAARIIIKEQKRSGGHATQSGDRLKFCQLMLKQGLKDFIDYSAHNGPVFFDRGLPDLLGYKTIATEPIWSSTIKKVERANQEYRYNQQIFLFPPWQEIYTTDEERVHSFAQAVLVYELLKTVLSKVDYQLVEVPRLSVEQRVQFILDKISI
jgi:predicted ATPase